MFHRSVTNQILKDLEYFPVVGIVGPRQVGKTTLAKSLQETLKQESLYLDLELETDSKKLFDAEAFLKFHQDKCVIIDEVQRMPSLFALLRALVDMDRRPARFILLGSSSPEMVKGSSETLAGRIAYTELTPFSWLEVRQKYTMKEHWLNGGFPPALLANDENQTVRWLESFIETLIYRDLPEFGHEISPQLTNKLFSMLSVLNGNLLNMSNLARSLSATHPTINRYLDILEGSFMIHRLYPYITNVPKRLVKAPKIYVRDSGILHSSLGISNYDQLVGHPNVGGSWEGYVIEQIRRVAVGNWKFYFYRTHKGAEADLVLVSPKGKKACIEIKFSTSPTMQRGFYETLEDIKPDYKFVIIPDGDAYPKSDGIWVCSLDEFLRKYLLTIDEDR